jgi:ribose transport system substrate-binding protein
MGCVVRRTARAVSIVAAATAVLAAAGCGSDSDSAAKGDGGGGGGGTKVYRVVLSNNFLGNDFRPQMERLAQLTAEQPPFKDKIKLEIENAENTTPAQVASLNSIVQSKPDAILVDAGSPTALNPAIKRACAAGITVVSFDQPVTEPCAWKVAQSHGDGQIVVGQWMSWALKNSGSIFVDRGLPGAPVSKEIQDNFTKGLKMDGAAIKVAGEFDGKYAPGPEQQGISQLLVGNKSVAGVMTQGYCSPVFKAFSNAKISATPAATCYGYNGELVACAKQKAKCAILTGSPVVVQTAMEVVLKALDGQGAPPKDEQVPVPMKLYVSNSEGFQPKENPANVEIENIELGKNAYPDLPPGLALPFTSDTYDISAEQASGK